MKKLEYSVFAIIAAFMLLTLNGCSEDEYIEDSLPPDLWRVYKDDIAITDTIGQRYPECSFEVPTEGGTYRTKCLKNVFLGYEIVQPDNYQGLLTVVGDGNIDYSVFYDITFAPNTTGTSHHFIIRCFGAANRKLLVNALQEPLPQ